jgi:hypothetical protein
VSIKFLRKALETQGLLSFSREFLCLDPVASSLRAIPEEDWLAGQEADMLPLPEANFSLSYEVAMDGGSAAVAVAWYSEDGIPHVQVLEHKAGFNWLPKAVADLLTKHR